MITRLLNKWFHCALIILFLHTLFANFMLQAQNTNPVGAIPGVIDVSPMGAATYTIPIEVVPGTQGIQPNLSIVYNSFSGMGLLGMKWNLGGLSAITRCGQTPYYDGAGNITAIQFTHADRFMLDGERLISLGNDTYATEIENFTRIVLHGGTTNPTHFIAYTDDGTIIEYGNTSNSKQIMTYPSTSVLSWQINKITDFNGNEMTFIYYNSLNDNEINIQEIRYTGNSSNSARVTFNYIPLPELLGRNTHYVKGHPIQQTQLLRNIIISYNGAVVRKYQFNYIHDPLPLINNERTVHLEKVTLWGEDENEKLNETIIIWRDQSSNSTTSYALSNLTIPYGYIVTGDFDGDGYMDVVNYDGTLSGKKWQLYLGNESGSAFTASGSSYNHPSNSLFFSADVNGDGCHELIIAATMDVELRWYEFKILSIKDEVIQIDSKQIKFFDQLFFGDFDGDGKTDILFGIYGYNDLSREWEYSFQMYSSASGFTTPSLKFTIYNDMKCKVRVGDFNGYGKTDLELHLANGDIKRYYYATNGQFALINPIAETANYAMTRYSGDFNGDGITDLLTFYNSWQISFGTGDGKYTNPVTVSDLNSQLEGSFYGVPRYKIGIADFDGDGKDDIVQFMAGGSRILYSKGAVDGQYKYKRHDVSFNYSGDISISIADMNNDGFLDIITKGSLHTSPHQISLINKDKQYDFPQKITDGMGKTIHFTFQPKYLPAKDFNVSRNIIQKYFHFLIDKLQVSNGLGTDLNLFQYQYDVPAFSLLRKSFLGFKEFVCTNQAENKKDLYKFLTNNSWHILVPESQTIYYNNLKSNETTHNLSFIGFGKRYIPYSNGATIIDQFRDSKTIITNSLDGTTGRLTGSNTKTYNTGNANPNDWMHSETKTYTYETITFSGNHKRTVPKRILATQQYGSNGQQISDTLTYSCYDSGENKGRLNWERRANIHGAITTTYEEYKPTGVYGKKTVSAQNCEPRIETYEYDNTHRFIKTITNPEGHITSFTHDAKTENILSETDANGLTTTYSYDSFGNLTEIYYPDGNRTTIRTDWCNTSIPPHARFYTTTATTGKPTLKVYYDLLGREVCREDDNVFFDTRYNAKGQVIKTSYPYIRLKEPDNSKIWREYTYDIYGRKDAIEEPYTRLTYVYDKRKVTVTDHLRGVSSWKDYDALGRIIKTQDAGGNITYSYKFAYNEHTTTITYNGATTTIFFDLWGNRFRINDPNAGTIYYAYNGFNELIEQYDACYNITTWQYDGLGRITQKKYTAPNYATRIITYHYDNFSSTSKGIGKLHKIMIYAEESEVFTYDTLSRLSVHNKRINGAQYKYDYTYTSNGNLHTLTYPSGFGVTYNYTNTGKLLNIMQSDDNNLIYQVNSRNKYNMPVSCLFGNELATEYKYNEYGLPTQIKTGNKHYDLPLEPDDGKSIPDLPHLVDSSILNYRYAYNDNGLMASRSESVINRLEKFTYDNLDRLIEVSTGSMGKPGRPQTFSYEDNGNIADNSKVGAYTYDGKKLNAVTKILPVNKHVISSDTCDVTYNFFNQPTQIMEGDSRFNLFYGADQQRNMEIKYKNNAMEHTRYYTNKYYEKEIAIGDTAKTMRLYHYIYGDNGAVALHISTAILGTDTIGTELDPNLPMDIDTTRSSKTIDSIYYIHTDHLGSYCAITDERKNVVQRNFFDPWGNYISLIPTIPEVDTTTVGMQRESHQQFPLTRRGFTGHEHYPEVKIINMNNRLYDPVIGRFFSPDNYVQLPEFTQAFNRYSYCLNNPLKYVDPTGQRFVDVDDDYGLHKDGRVELLRETKDNFDRLIALDAAGRETNTQMTLNKANYLDKTLLYDLFKSGKASNFATSFAIGDENSQSAMIKTFKFVADNSNVEWRVERFNNNGYNNYAIGTAHNRARAITSEQMGYSTRDVIAFMHSHPNINSRNELSSMGWLGNNRYIPYSDVGLRTNNDYYKTTLYYTYFPESGNLWNVGSNQQPAFIRNVTDYTRFFFGIFNTR
jgi:RHS repeat-associated protein